MTSYVRPQIYSTMPVSKVEAQLRRGKMPAPFTRRMRVINILSAATLRKIEDDMLAPFDVMDLHHALDAQVSQDAIINALENKSLAVALASSNLYPLWVKSKEKPLLRKGFEQGWIQRFIYIPFDPICVMLALRAKMMLDVVDELGHSYNLIRSLGFGWIDFGNIPGEEAGDPDSYIPPGIDTPIDYPDIPPEPGPGDPGYVPGPGEPDYIPPRDLTPDDPGYTTEPGSPGYTPPRDLTPDDPGYTTEPGSPGYTPPIVWPRLEPGEIPEPVKLRSIGIRIFYPEEAGAAPGPGEPGYVPPPTPPPAPPPTPAPAPAPPPAPAPAPAPGAGGASGDVETPSTLGWAPGGLFGPGGYGGSRLYAHVNCCLDYQDPGLFVTIGYYTNEIDAGETLGLTVEQADPNCGGENYIWEIAEGPGELSAGSGLDVIYTAPADGHDCPGNTTITLSCKGEVVDTLVITINYDYAIEFNYGDPELEIDQNDSLAISVTANGTPLRWEVEGTGFSLEQEETEGKTNTLHADETACGTATITIIDCDGNVATGFVRGSTGQWVFKSNTCGLQGTGIVYLTNYSEKFCVRLIQGNKKQETQYNVAGTTTEKDAREGTFQEVCVDGANPCPAWIVQHCHGLADCLDHTVDCVVLAGASHENCAQETMICHGPCGCGWNGSQYEWHMDFNEYATPSGSYLKYSEWEC